MILDSGWVRYTPTVCWVGLTATNRKDKSKKRKQRDPKAQFNPFRPGRLGHSRLISESMMSSLASPMVFLAIPSHVSSGSKMTSLIALR